MTSTPVPLARLLAMAYRELIDDLHERLRQRGWTDVRPAFGFVLLAARDDHTTTSQLAELMGTTKQAASKLAANMVAAGFLVQAAGESDGRQRPLRLTKRGRKLLTAVESIYSELENGWSERIGVNEVERVRRALTRVITRTDDGQLPPVRPTW
jgi:DNA-binding MarR family transcriptional regulator